MKQLGLLAFFLLNVQLTFSQGADPYWKTITDRSAKIVTHLALTDDLKTAQATEIIRDQYFLLNACYELRNLKKKDNADNSLKEQIDAETLRETTHLNELFVTRLKEILSVTQVDAIKNGMTYHVYPNTVKAYQDMIPTLKNDEVRVIDSLLYEARELAMQAESSEKKHAWFGKYKGKINNYLASHGYNLKEEGERWAARLKKTNQ